MWKVFDELLIVHFFGEEWNGLWLDDGEAETHKKGQEANYAASVAEPCCSDLARRLSRTSVDVNI